MPLHALMAGCRAEYLEPSGRKVHNVELHNFYSSYNIIRIITSTRMQLVEQKHACQMRNAYKISFKKPEG
jgi:hypothetical protein